MGLFIFWALCAVAGVMIGSSKGRGGTGLALALFFGPIGVLIIALMKGNRRECPSCKSTIHAEATICPMCRSEVPATVQQTATEAW